MIRTHSRSQIAYFRFFLVLCVCILFLIVQTLPTFASSFTSSVGNFGHATYIQLNSVYYPTAQLTHTSCGSWTFQYDQFGYAENWSQSTGSKICTGATWNLNGYYYFAQYYLWVPSSDATANICIGFYSQSKRIAVGCVNEGSQDYIDAWAPIPNSSNLQAINQVKLTSNDGQTNTDIGLGAVGSSLKMAGNK